MFLSIASGDLPEVGDADLLGCRLDTRREKQRYEKMSLVHGNSIYLSGAVKLHAPLSGGEATEKGASFLCPRVRHI